MTASGFDPARHQWRRVTGAPDGSYFVHHEYTILGHDLAAGTLDMVVRWDGDGGHCPLHRHTATTSVLVLGGEQGSFRFLASSQSGADADGLVIVRVGRYGKAGFIGIGFYHGFGGGRLQNIVVA